MGFLLKTRIGVIDRRHADENKANIGQLLRPHALQARCAADSGDLPIGLSRLAAFPEMLRC